MVKNKSLSITMAELNRQLSTAFALMTILPMAALSYFIITYIVPNIVTRENIFLVFFISMVLSLCGFSILKRIVGSILKLEEYVKAIAKGDITQKIDFRNSREIGNIGKALNTILQKMQDYQEELKRLNKNLDKMVKQRTAELETSYKELKDTESMLIQSEKMAAVGQLASGIAHEVKNPLAVITQGIAYLEKTAIPDKERWAEILNMIKDAINRSDKIVRGLLGFARPSPLQLKPRSIEEVIDSALGLIRHQLIQNKIELSKQIAPNLPLVIIDDNQIVQVLVNLILNSMNAMPD
ncbi:MAG: HAMP domain-containing protein, partial [Candidatus Omnitrophica bacterium]|nr:HAMP domain-containing protein [Candidatus Omnitrophota bacterium]